MRLLGWPDVSTKSVTERELRSLTGEGLHLGCLCLVLASTIADPSAPWWSAGGDQTHERISQPQAQQVAAVGQGMVPPPKKPRRLGPVKSVS